MSEETKNFSPTRLPLEWLGGAFNALEATINGESKTPFHLHRKGAFLRATELGIPSAKDESWRYTNLAELAKGEWRAAAKKDPALVSHALLKPFLSSETTAPRLVFVDGYFTAALSRLSADVDLQIVSPHGDENVDSSALEKFFRRSDLNEVGEPLDELNASFVAGGALIRFAKGTEYKAPVEIVFVSTAEKGKELISPRLAIIAEENSRAEVTETYLSLGTRSYCTNSVTDVTVLQGAHLTHTKIQCEGEEAFHLGRLNTRISRSSTFVSNVFHFGGKLVRNEIHPELGEGCECYLNGLTAVCAEQQVDNTTVIDHAEPNAFSREMYKGVYGDKSRGVFSGTIIVRQDAQKTNAIQSNKSILLTDTASIDSRPQLKIWADDVKCTHGATVGQLDEHALFYLRSRGIAETTARNMLVHAFSSEIIHSVERLETRELLERLLMSKLGTHLA